MYDDYLPFTGAGGIAVAGYTIGLPWLLTAGAVLIISGLALYRIATRGRRRARQG
ncbi:hypothetical protein [Nonomuraea sp. bgisy101]|uniref:hypothetical protein n=1 Tax=Nonomuraea sp. bgisy101 TaxID=3413784 RepID=UPI003D722540